MFISRHIEAHIRQCSSSFPALLLTGPRQVGKSTLLQKMFPEIKYISLDNSAALLAMAQDSLGFLELQGTPLILDEIQRTPQAFLSLKYIIDHDRRPGMYLLTGSQRFELMQNVSDSLAGRIAVISLLGLSNREINGDSFSSPFLPTLEYFQQRHPQPMISPAMLWQRIHHGSMPELYANPSVDWYNFYASYVSTYVERDVRQLTQVGDTLAFTQFMTALAARTGELLNMAAVARDVGIDAKTCKRWLSILQATGLVYLLQPFSLNLNKRLVKTPKIYFTDTGLVSFLCRWLTPDTLCNGAMSGNIFETWVVSEILKSYYNAGREPDIFFFRNSDGQEIDLLFYRDGQLFPLEIKKTVSPNQKDIKHFKVLKTFFPSLTVNEGGIICNQPLLLPLDGSFRSIPLNML